MPPPTTRISVSVTRVAPATDGNAEAPVRNRPLRAEPDRRQWFGSRSTIGVRCPFDWHLACPSLDRNALIQRSPECAPRPADRPGDPGGRRHPRALGVYRPVPARLRAHDGADLRGLARLAPARARCRRHRPLAATPGAVHADEGDRAVLRRA